MPESTIRSWENGNPISNAALAALQRLGANLDYLLNGEGQPLRRDAIPGRPVVIVNLPIYSGAAAEKDYASAEARLVVHEAMEEGVLSLPDGCCGVRVVGSSMEPIALDGQYLLLAPAGRSARNGDLVVASLKDGHGIYFKRYYGIAGRSGGGQRQVNLLSANPVLNIEPITVSEDDIDDLRVVIGVIFEG